MSTEEYMVILANEEKLFNAAEKKDEVI